MSKAATRSRTKEHHKAQAQGYLSDVQRLLRQLAADRRRQERRRGGRTSIVAEVRAILHKA
jgi:hypothetical protein